METTTKAEGGLLDLSNHTTQWKRKSTTFNGNKRKLKRKANAKVKTKGNTDEKMEID